MCAHSIMYGSWIRGSRVDHLCVRACVRAPPPTNVSRWLYNRYQLSSRGRTFSLARSSVQLKHACSTDAFRLAPRLKFPTMKISDFEFRTSRWVSQEGCCWLGQALFNGLRTQQFSGLTRSRFYANECSLSRERVLIPGSTKAIVLNFFKFSFFVFCFLSKYRNLRSNEDSRRNICSE